MKSGGSRGIFIAFEGGEGTGKSTQVRMLADSLRSQGHTVNTTREPGGTPGAEAIRSLLLDPPGEGWTREAEALLFAAARADHVDQLILPALERGDLVLSDRFLDSSRAYQGGAGGLADADILHLHQFGSADLRPDLTLLLEVDDDVRTARLAARDGKVSDAIGGRSAAYHAEVARAFRSFAEQDPDRVRRIDGGGSPGEVHARVMTALAPLLERASA
ncbi:dTMP kinase [Erythrobacter sp.]|jgi:dTMP kinase|uniref:dTMP kinase n=1 Tax=Erythrobacter sp. TaxID=1042 RepID=UPI002EBB4042|nr:dTMP kinase [Erythrobacter sp.]